jgi:peptidyl-prolyl cis-trans isomerase A (cyclophilin A)
VKTFLSISVCAASLMYAQAPATKAPAAAAPTKPAVPAAAKPAAAKPAVAAAKPAGANVPAAAKPKPVPAPPKPVLTNPATFTTQAPDTFKVKCSTPKGDFVVQVNRAWAPLGADRFYNLIRAGFYNDAYFFRLVKGFVVQFGIHANPAISKVWRGANLQDDAVRESNKRGTISFATGGPNTRTTQLFINLVDNSRLDGMGFAPFAFVVEGMDVVDKLYDGYGEEAQQGLIQEQGAAYLRKNFPMMDYIKTAVIYDPTAPPPAAAAKPAAAKPAVAKPAVPAAKPAVPAAKPAGAAVPPPAAKKQ